MVLITTYFEGLADFERMGSCWACIFVTKQCKNSPSRKPAETRVKSRELGKLDSRDVNTCNTCRPEAPIRWEKQDPQTSALGQDTPNQLEGPLMPQQK